VYRDSISAKAPSAMLDITPEDIHQLNDTDLRTLVGLLCEAELERRGLSSAAVTWGGNQTAADGGLDVRVELPAGTEIDGFIPRAWTGFQVKKPDMPQAKIHEEMKPKGVFRPVIQELADNSGAYVIVSSNGTTADIRLQERRQAMRDALKSAPNEDKLATDFYDRTRLASWTRRYPSLVFWVKERVGRSHVGWYPYKAWSGGEEGAEAEYLLDDSLRLHLNNGTTRSISDAIDVLRDKLAKPRSVVRLVGLSGVGKTRFVQALFDKRIGLRPLASSLAVYTNLSDNPTPEPIGMATHLTAQQFHTVLVVDNCPSQLHGRLSEICRATDSNISVITVEYDIREDQPEGTEVVELDTSSTALIEKLLTRRYSRLSQIDARTIADASGGNARIAVAIAETVQQTDSIAGLSNEDLFQRLFHQRHLHNDTLLQAAQACSLVYSFEGVDQTSPAGELAPLAQLIESTPRQLYGHVAKMIERDLIQKRGVWRAVLPHAIANYLAVRALREIPHDLIEQLLVDDGSERLALSFSRRLSFLHNNEQAQEIVRRWLAPKGRLGNLAALTDFGLAMFANISPVLPEYTLQALERSANLPAPSAGETLQQHLSLLRSLAYDACLFERCTKLLTLVAMQAQDDRDGSDASSKLSTLFTLYLSGTHASVHQKLQVIERLLTSDESKSSMLGKASLSAMLNTDHFSTAEGFEFGARSRNYGYEPQGFEDVVQWYGLALELMRRLNTSHPLLNPILRDLIAAHIQGLWRISPLQEALESLCRSFVADGFWDAGWVACSRYLRYARKDLSPVEVSRLEELQSLLKPITIVDQVCVTALSRHSFELQNWKDIPFDEALLDTYDHVDAIAHTLGTRVATNEPALDELLPKVLRGGPRVFAFGRGLGISATATLWARLLCEFESIPSPERNVEAIAGFLSGVNERDKRLARGILDTSFDHPELRDHFPRLMSVLRLDSEGVRRLIKAMDQECLSTEAYRNISVTFVADDLRSSDLCKLLLRLANLPGGYEIAVEKLTRLLRTDQPNELRTDPQVLAVGRQLLSNARFDRSIEHLDFELGEIAEACLKGPDAQLIAGEIARQLKQAVAAGRIYTIQCTDMVAALLDLQPIPFLDVLLCDNEEDLVSSRRLFRSLANSRQGNLLDSIPNLVLLPWCEAVPEHRFELIASLISFGQPDASDVGMEWTTQAKMLLAKAPDPMKILQVFINRFAPMPWSGSRATLMEMNGQLLDRLEPGFYSKNSPAIESAKIRIAEKVADERMNESTRHREQVDRFE
jgi:hypothetical protein